jgi:hypothetical protein
MTQRRIIEEALGIPFIYVHTFTQPISTQWICVFAYYFTLFKLVATT